jgi:hypothetical protein
MNSTAVIWAMAASQKSRSQHAPTAEQMRFLHYEERITLDAFRSFAKLSDNVRPRDTKVSSGGQQMAVIGVDLSEPVFGGAGEVKGVRRALTTPSLNFLWNAATTSAWPWIQHARSSVAANFRTSSHPLSLEYIRTT